MIGRINFKLKGTVEADDTYVGGKTHGKRGRGAENKTTVFSLVERKGKKLYLLPLKELQEGISGLSW